MQDTAPRIINAAATSGFSNTYIFLLVNTVPRDDKLFSKAESPHRQDMTLQLESLVFAETSSRNLQ